MDYKHRVGRTARAGRSGVAVSLVNQYEVEWFVQIEKFVGKKFPEFPFQEEEVLLLIGSVKEAKRVSLAKIKELGGKNGKKRGGDDDDEDMDKATDKYMTHRNVKSSKKVKK